jgi:hypothetical protein
MNNEEQLIEGIAGLKKITFRSVLGKTQGKLTLCPGRSKITKRLIGVKVLSEDERRVSSYVVTEDTEVVVYDGYELDMEDHIDKTNWQWMKHLPELVATLEDSYGAPTALFYVENLNKDTEIRITERSFKTKAFGYLQEASQSKRVEVCRILGTDASTMSPIEIEDYLGEMADSASKKLVNAFEDKLIKVKLFLYALLDKRIINVDADGVYSWGSHILGVNEKSALEWLQLRDNSQYIKRLHDIVYPKPQVTSFNDSHEIREIAMPVTNVSQADLEDDLEDFKLPQVPEPVLQAAYAPSTDASLEIARDRFNQLFGKRPGNMSLANIMTKIEEAEQSSEEII